MRKTFRHAGLLWLELLLSGGAGLVVADQTVYDDALVNGWQNYGWATLNYANTSPVHSGARSISVTAAAYQALYLYHASFNTTGFSNLTFWIHGGTTGGQALRVQALLIGNPQTSTNLPLLTTGWQQITLSLAALGVANQPNMDGFWIQSLSGASIPAFYVDDIQLTSAPPPAVVHVSIVATQTVRTVDARIFGLNTAVWDSVLDTTNTIGLLKEMDNQALRFPGGSLSDDYHWAANKSGTNTWQWASSFTKFTDVATNTQARVFITVNYGSGTPAEAAAWVQHANVTNQLACKYWEVGNENYGTWETDLTPRPHDPFTYATRFQDYANQMKDVDPSIKIGAVCVTGEDSYANYTDHPATNSRTHAVHNGWTPVLLTTLKSLGVTPDFLIYHRYEQAPGSENDETLLQSAATWPNDAADLRQQLTDYLGAAATNVELVCTENNSVYTNPGKQSTSLVNGLFLADSLGHILQTEFNACLWWDLRNGQESGNNNAATLYGWRTYGDYGITDSSNPSLPANRYPTFFVAKLLKYFARGGDRIVSATSDYSRLTAFAAQRQDASLSVLVINKHPTATLKANLALAGYLPNSNVVMYSYGIPQDDAARFGTGSADVAQTNIVLSPPGTNLTYAFAPYSATVLSLNPPFLNLLLAVQTNSLAQLRILGQPGLRCVIQTSSNLVSWSSIVTNTLSGEVLDWQDPDSAGVKTRFYRARWLP
jgi:alpha-L-arabinofuranosidase